MKTLTELFKQIHKVYPYKLTLLDDQHQLLATSTREENSNNKEFFSYPIKTQTGGRYYLVAEKEIAKETLGILEILIGLYLEKFQSLDKKQVLQQIIVGNWDEEIIKEINKKFTNDFTVYQILFIETPTITEEVELVEMLEECFKEEEDLTVILLEQGILLFIEGEKTKEDLVAMARLIRDMVNAELYIDVLISISSKFKHLKELPNKLIDAKKTMTIGKTLAFKSHIFIEEELNLEKTILSIPRQEREKLYIEIYKKAGYDEIEDEIQLTIEIFLKNNLNLGETAKALFIHRNTLAYRLDRIQKTTELDLRRFEDAMFYKIGMLLKKSL